MLVPKTASGKLGVMLDPVSLVVSTGRDDGALVAGDLIVKVNFHDVQDIEDYHREVAKAPSLVSLHVKRPKASVDQLTGVYILQHQATDLCLDGGSASDDFGAFLRSRRPTPPMWELRPVDGGYYNISRHGSDQCLHAWDSEGMGWRVVTRPSQGDERQQWRLTEVDAERGYLRITQRMTGRCLDAADPRSILTQFPNDSATQTWLLHRVSEEELQHLIAPPESEASGTDTRLDVAPPKLYNISSASTAPARAGTGHLMLF